jgi:hypothetical protein
MHPDANPSEQPQTADPSPSGQANGGAGQPTAGVSPGKFLPLDERERQLNEDYEWCLRSADIQQAYGGKVVVVHQRKVLGVGEDHLAALEAAAGTSCPPREQLAIVVVPESSVSGQA